MYLKTHRAPDGTCVTAICDRELLNTKVSDGDLEVCISEAFYGNRSVSDEEARNALKSAENVNLMGERSVSIAIDMGLVDRTGCIMIGKVPHAQIFSI
jgi:hypothetical protein